MPSLVPVRVAKDSSPPGWGDPLSGPECTNLKIHKRGGGVGGWYGILTKAKSTIFMNE